MNARSQQGATLIELMITLLVGSLLMTGLVTFYLQSARDFHYQQALSQVQETGRFTTHFLADHLKRAGFWGHAWQAEFAGSFTASDGLLSAPARAGYTSGAGPLPVWSGESPCLEPGCSLLPAAYQATAASPMSQALALRYADASSSGGADITLASTGNCLQLDLPDETPGCGALANQVPRTLWAYRALFFAVRQLCVNVAGQRVGCGSTGAQAVPALYMGVLGSGGYRMNEIAPGVELLHLEWGLDDTGDGLPNRLVSGSNTVALSLDEWRRAVSVQLYVVVQSEPLNIPDNHASPVLRLGQVSYTPPRDNRVRRVFSTSVSLGNLRYRRGFIEGAP
ncbi:PilW family protein [Larsenimonas rhizosphaerae]|uniref:PilW family protein n=1 Tax=Larsenimonas rhizosphaerae TaxID=2944682 RepID=A0AA42CW20_9GAMM|nr:PilW family protein [Larsenimonas rhizosphaerae]MCM2132214.1 PilW family protein [Larsenimonas rhizosphaerae]MCX2525471.1 PilW family protein [Larsenimonas rhizosphaerae]